MLVHEYSAADRDVLIQFPVGTLGDTMGWFPYAVKFKERTAAGSPAHGEKLIPLFRDAYPDITFVTHEEVKPERYYATYSIWACSSTTRISCTSRAISAMSGCTAPPATSSASIRPK